MKEKIFLIFCFAAVLQAAKLPLTRSNKQLSEVNKCLSRLHKQMGNEATTTLSGIVGVGWDDLTNKVTLPIFATKFDECQTTPDGHFLIPDNVIAMPIQEVFVDRQARSFKSYNDVEKETITADRQEVSSFVGGGAFSSGNQDMKKHFASGNTMMMEVKIGYKAFTFIVEPDELDPAFQLRIDEIVESLDRGQPILAKYQAECIIRDYGTHVVNQALTGASMKYIAFVENQDSHVHGTTKSQMESEAAASFFGWVNGGEKSTSEKSESEKNGFEKKLQYSHTETKGGSDVRKVINSDEAGSLSSMDNIVGLKHEGTPIYLLIHKSYFPSSTHNTSTFLNIQNLIFTVTKEYYEANTVKGCTDPLAVNFQYEANVDDGSCTESVRKFLFDGVFQRCYTARTDPSPWTNTGMTVDLVDHDKRLHDKYTVNHPLAHLPTCPEGYDEILLHSTYLHYYTPINNQTMKFPVEYYDIFQFANYRHIGDFPTVVEYKTFWCRRKVDTLAAHDGALFGGFVIDGGLNTVTKANGCPAGYKENLLFETVILCLSYNYDSDKHNSVPFGGFYSCESTEKQCPEGYEANLLKIVNGCTVYYCIIPSKAQISTTYIALKRPPFIKFSDAIADPGNTINEVPIDPLNI